MALVTALQETVIDFKVLAVALTVGALAPASAPAPTEIVKLVVVALAPLESVTVTVIA